VRAGQVYFDIATDNNYWRKVAQDRELAVYLPPFFEPSRTQLTLLAIPSHNAPAPARRPGDGR
jgi:hypothetical protein